MIGDWAFEADEHFGAQAPLSPLDDHLIHQTPDPIRVVASTDPRFYERHWNVFHDEAGDLLIATGGSFYPNLDTAEAYAIVTAMGPTYFWFQWQTLRDLAGSFGLGPAEADAALRAMLDGAVRTFFDSGLAAGQVMDPVPVKPLADAEPQMSQAYREVLPKLYAKLKGA